MEFRGSPCNMGGAKIWSNVSLAIDDKRMWLLEEHLCIH